MIASRFRDGKMKLKIRSYGFAPVVKTFAEGVQRPPHFREMLIVMANRGQCGRFGFETNAEFQHCQDIAESRYSSWSDAKILSSCGIQNKGSDSMPGIH